MLSTFIDTDRYPIDDLDSQAGRDLVGRCRKMLSGHTLCLLEGFLREDAVAALTTELAELEGEAHKVNYPSTVYGWMNNAGFPPDHPRSRLEPRQCGVLSTDLFDSSGPSWELFRLDALREFVRRVLGYETLFRSECPTLAIQANVMGEGETSAGTMTPMMASSHSPYKMPIKVVNSSSCRLSGTKTMRTTRQ